MRALLGISLLVLLIAAPPVAMGSEDAQADIDKARQLAKEGLHGKAAEAFEAYLKAHAKGKDVFGAYTGAFHAHAAAGDVKRAQKIGKQIFKRYPDAKGTFQVLATWLEKGWKVPKLATSYKTLRYWTFDRIDATRRPDRRLAFLEVIAKQHKLEDFVKDKGILYSQAWAHMEAGRIETAIELGEKYLRAKPRGSYVDRTRILVAKAMLAESPPRTADATKLLRLVADNKDSRYKTAAKDLLAAAGAAPPSIQLTEGFPTADGLGTLVVLTNLAKSNARRKAIRPWLEARKASVVTFRGEDVMAAAPKLRKLGAEFVAVLVDPRDIDNNFQLSMLELCRGLDKDPMPDFHYGYLAARDAADLAAFTTSILAKEKAGGTVARQLGVQNLPKALLGVDFAIHYGHGTARGINQGPSAAQAANLPLPGGPVIFSGACFNGVCARTHERYILGNHHGKPDEIAPNDVIALSWIHAGATGFFAALDGDRGEMAGAEWEHFLEHAPSLGATIGHQYRLIFTSLRESFKSFPRYTPGAAKNKSFYSVMLRGQTSRILLSDPMYRPLHGPLTKPSLRTTVTEDKAAGTVTVRVEVLRRPLGPFVNTLPKKSGTPFKETRLYERVALPRGFEGKLGFPTVDTGKVKTTRVQAKHEIWGGQRYINVQAESDNWNLTVKGAVATFVFKRVP